MGGVALIQKVRPDSISDTDNNGYTQIFVVKILLKFTFAVYNRRTPLHWATVCENIDTIKILLQLGGV